MRITSPVLAGPLALFLAAAAQAAASATGPVAIVPQPTQIALHEGAFQPNRHTVVLADAASKETATFLVERLRRSTGYPFDVKSWESGEAPARDVIVLTSTGAEAKLGSEGYTLQVGTSNVVIRATTQTGVFYGVQTLLQLFPPAVFSSNEVPDTNWEVPCLEIVDRPRFQWRGLLLDVSRHFFSKSEIKTLLDVMALHKLNRFHWHLVDDHGWRLEIKKYPKLTEVGAWRSGIGFGLDPKSATAYGPDGRYGGFYTQQDVREIVAYAAARHITIVPEIEMPGHSTAALAAYPQFSCTGGPFVIPFKAGVFDGIYNPANEATFRFLEEVLSEVFELFPGEYIHIGGDEVPKDTWKHSAECQALMKREGLKNEEELQSWFIRRIAAFVKARGRRLVGWSEILQGGLAPNATVMDWIGGATDAARTGHDVVMTPTAYCYFDQYQSSNHVNEPKAAEYAGPVTLEKVYSFEPVPANLPAQFQAHILGAQGNLWTEQVPSLQRAEYMLFPRLIALAEVDWSARSTRDFSDFARRLGTDCQRLDVLGINYRHWHPATDTRGAVK